MKTIDITNHIRCTKSVFSARGTSAEIRAAEAITQFRIDLFYDRPNVAVLRQNVWRCRYAGRVS